MKGLRLLQGTLKRGLKTHNVVYSCSPSRHELGQYRPGQVRLYSSELTAEHVEPSKVAESSQTSEPESPSTAAQALEPEEIAEISKTSEPNSPKATFRKTTQEPSTLSPIKFRELMRHVPRPVVVLTAVDFPSLNQKPSKEKKHPEKSANSKETPGDLERTEITEETAEASETTEATHRTSNLNDAKYDLSDVGPIPRAMTLSSFSSLSVEPRPQVMFNVHLPSKTYDAIKSTRRFNIHVLADTAKGARLAARFSKGNSSLVDDNGVLVGKSDQAEESIVVSNRDLWEKDWARCAETQKDGKYLPFRPISRAALPVLRSSAVLYVLQCVLPQGKHTHEGIIYVGNGKNKKAIVVGTVEGCIASEQLGKFGHGEKNTALSYVHQNYQKAGKRIDPFTLYKIPSEGPKKDPKPFVKIWKHKAPLVRKV